MLENTCLYKLCENCIFYISKRQSDMIETALNYYSLILDLASHTLCELEQITWPYSINKIKETKNRLLSSF